MGEKSMDTALNNGEFLLDVRGRPVQISGIQEILQQVLIKLTIKKGSFIYNPNLGSELHTLQLTKDNLQANALMLVKEALKDMLEVVVENVNVELTNDGENMNLTVLISINDQMEEVTITL